MLRFKPPAPLPDVPRVEVAYNAPFQSVEVELRRPHEYGRSAGREGLGSQFFSDREDGSLCGILLDMNTYGIVDTPPMSLLEPVRSHIRGLARPGALTLANFPAEQMVADAVWLCFPFGAALWSFDDLVIESTDKFVQSVADSIYVEVGRGLIIGMRADTGVLRCVFVDGFDRRQWVLGKPVSAETHDAAFMEQLNSIHWSFFADPELEEGTPNPLQKLRFDPALPEQLRELATRYIDDLRVLAELEPD